MTNINQIQSGTLTSVAKVNGLPARFTGRLQSASVAPKGCDKELRPFVESPSDADIVPRSARRVSLASGMNGQVQIQIRNDEFNSAFMKRTSQLTPTHRR
jgi:hypothetical protein